MTALVTFRKQSIKSLYTRTNDKLPIRTMQLAKRLGVNVGLVRSNDYDYALSVIRQQHIRLYINETLHPIDQHLAVTTALLRLFIILDDSTMDRNATLKYYLKDSTRFLRRECLAIHIPQELLDVYLNSPDCVLPTLAGVAKHFGLHERDCLERLVYLNYLDRLKG